MLILPPGHAQQVGSLRRLSQRERWMVRGVLGVVAALAVVLAVSLIATGHSSRRGCIYVTIPAATGAEEINQCGQTARSTCLSASAPGAYSAQSARSIEAACRKAGLPVG